MKYTDNERRMYQALIEIQKTLQEFETMTPAEWVQWRGDLKTALTRALWIVGQIDEAAQEVAFSGEGHA